MLFEGGKGLQSEINIPHYSHIRIVQQVAVTRQDQKYKTDYGAENETNTDYGFRRDDMRAVGVAINR